MSNIASGRGKHVYCDVEETAKRGGEGNGAGEQVCPAAYTRLPPGIGFRRIRATAAVVHGSIPWCRDWLSHFLSVPENCDIPPVGN